jgi:predicted nucleic acid-binding protein
VNSVLLDTSFLITLSDPARERHDVALRYYKECISRHVPMMLSSVVISEFHVRQSVNDLEPGPHVDTDRVADRRLRRVLVRGRPAPTRMKRISNR